MSDLAVEVRGLEKVFSSAAENLRVLRGLDLSIPKGTSCSVMGASGSGKSTLLSILGGLERPDAGFIRIGDVEPATLSERKMNEFRSGSVGFIFQFHYLLKDFSALENVALPAYMRGVPKDRAWARAEELLFQVGLADRMKHYPSQLSGGERQRAAIARALVNGPAVVLADEPTGNLDAANALAVAELLFSLPPLREVTLVLATHDPELAGRADLHFLLRDGRLEGA